MNVSRKNIFYFIPFFMFLASHAEPLCIGVGSACGPALVMRMLGIRKEAYPFDWMMVPPQALCAALEDNFEHFLDQETLRPRKDNRTVVNEYGCDFNHDFSYKLHPLAKGIDADDMMLEDNLPLLWRQNILPKVQEKYKRRIERFLKACNGSEKVFFIRHFDTTPEQAIQIRDVMRKKYPQLDFILVVITSFKKDEISWGFPLIWNYYCNDDNGWTSPAAMATWQKIFDDIGVSYEMPTE